MALDPDQIAHACDLYLQKVASDPAAREALASAGGDRSSVAREIAKATGANVSEDDLDAMVHHLTIHRRAEIDSLAMQHPALGVIIMGSP